MNLATILTSPAVVLLSKWTGLLVLAWGAHGFLRLKDARWRLILWRSMLCFGLLLPLFQYVELPGLKIPVGTSTVALGDNSNQPAVTATGNQTSKSEPRTSSYKSGNADTETHRHSRSSDRARIQSDFIE